METGGRREKHLANLTRILLEIVKLLDLTWPDPAEPRGCVGWGVYSRMPLL